MLNLVEILKDYPKGSKLYSPICGELRFLGVRNNETFPIYTITETGVDYAFTKFGCFSDSVDAECVLFPSKENRNWGTFKKKEGCFDPHSFQPFDKILVRERESVWRPSFFAFLQDDHTVRTTDDCSYARVIPYNEETKHLVGTFINAPIWYHWW